MDYQTIAASRPQHARFVLSEHGHGNSGEKGYHST